MSEYLIQKVKLNIDRETICEIWLHQNGLAIVLDSATGEVLESVENVKMHNGRLVEVLGDFTFDLQDRLHIHSRGREFDAWFRSMDWIYPMTGRELVKGIEHAWEALDYLTDKITTENVPSGIYANLYQAHNALQIAYDIALDLEHEENR